MSRKGAAVLLAASLLVRAASAQPSDDKPSLLDRIRLAMTGWGTTPATTTAPATPEAVVVNPILEHSGPSYLYPNPVITPGRADPSVRQDNIDQTICHPHYTQTVRNVTQDDRALVLAMYGDYYPRKRSYELDHFISLELGGSNDVHNLWPEPYCPLPRRSDCFGAREKDVVETWLHRQVCAHKMSLHDAQTAIKTDWFSLYRRIKNRSGP